MHHLNPGARRERGVVMIVALLLLAALTLAGVTLSRSVSTGTLVAGNLAFQQGGTRSADRGVSLGMQWIDAQAVDALYNSIPVSGYRAFPLGEPPAGMSWSSYFDTSIHDAGLDTPAPYQGSNEDAAGNTVTFFIERLCSGPGSPNVVTCVSPTAGSNCARRGSSCSGGRQAMMGVGADGSYAGPSSLRLPVFYRITARSVGPRNTRSYVQAIFSK